MAILNELNFLEILDNSIAAINRISMKYLMVKLKILKTIKFP